VVLSETFLGTKIACMAKEQDEVLIDEEVKKELLDDFVRLGTQHKLPDTNLPKAVHLLAEPFACISPIGKLDRAQIAQDLGGTIEELYTQ